MTGPNDPEWEFPELKAADPASLDLPEPEPEPIYDTGSDGWWRAQAKAQREAAAGDPEPPPLFRPMPPAPAPPELIEPTVLNDPAFLPSGPSPLDDDYLPPEEVFPAVPESTWSPEPVAAYEPPPVAPPVALPVAPSEPFLEPEPYEAAYEEPAAFVAPEPEPVLEPETWVEQPPPWVEDVPVDEPFDPQASDWYDAGSAPFEDLDAEEGSGWRRAVAWASLALAGVGLIVVALLLLAKDDPKGTPAVSLPTASVTSTPSAEPTPTPTPEPTPTPTPTVSKVAAAPVAPIVPLLVLNNSRITGLAERSAAKFRAGGWPVPETGNYRGRVDTTTIYYPEGQRASALRFAKQFGVRVLPRFSSLPGSGMTVVVTRDFAS